MRMLFVLGLVGLSLASCTSTEKGATIGAVSGAAIGGAVSGDLGGAIVGGAVGGIAGAAIGHVADRPGHCYYRDRYGRRYVDRC
ncbi:MAG: glycine zipper domain-containing protein [Shinella sp.]|nr:glycine zipper domain-containing protein [Shinella sp.]